MQKIDITIAKLRLLLADVMAKEHQLTAMRQQFRDQLRKAIEFSVYGDASLDATLGLMGEVQQRVATTEAALRDIGLIRTRAERELQSLQLTKRIEAARSELNGLLARQAELRSGGVGEGGRELGAQIERIRQRINEASEQAAKTLDRR